MKEEKGWEDALAEVVGVGEGKKRRRTMGKSGARLRSNVVGGSSWIGSGGDDVVYSRQKAPEGALGFDRQKGLGGMASAWGAMVQRMEKAKKDYDLRMERINSVDPGRDREEREGFWRRAVGQLEGRRRRQSYSSSSANVRGATFVEREEEDFGLPPSDKRKGSDNDKANGEGRTNKDLLVINGK